MSMRWLAAVLMTLASATAWANEARAVLTELRGKPVVYELSNGEARQVAMVVEGRSYALPLEVETGAADAATFALSNSVIEVSANSMMRIVAPEQGANNIVQRVLQGAGSALFRVHRGTIERFQVETPFLVSVVKGTVFNVLVREDGATVSLQEGRLEVSSVDLRQNVELLPGDVAFAGPDGVLRVLDVQLTNSDVKARSAVTPRAVGDEASSDVVALANASADAARATGAPLAPLADTIVKNVAEPSVAPIAPVVETTVSVIAPVVDTVVPVVDAVVPVVDAVVAPVVDLVTPVVDTVVIPLVGALEPVIVPVVDGLADPIASTLDPLVPDVVTTTVDTSVMPIVDPLVPVLDPLLPDAEAGAGAASTGPLGGLLGTLR
jgi:hypothetical protein